MNSCESMLRIHESFEIDLLALEAQLQVNFNSSSIFILLCTLYIIFREVEILSNSHDLQIFLCFLLKTILLYFYFSLFFLLAFIFPRKGREKYFGSSRILNQLFFCKKNSRSSPLKQFQKGPRNNKNKQKMTTIFPGIFVGKHK